MAKAKLVQLKKVQHQRQKAWDRQGTRLIQAVENLAALHREGIDAADFLRHAYGGPWWMEDWAADLSAARAYLAQVP